MSFPCSCRPWCRIFACFLISTALSGCGGGSPTVATGPSQVRDEIARSLPPGVTLESPVVPNPMYGPGAKTVGDALASLQAYVRDGAIYDGGLGSEIHFKKEGKALSETKGAGKTRKRGTVPTAQTVIELAK